MRLILAISILLISAVSCNVAPDDNEVAGGTFVGYSFAEQAVVDAAIAVEADYTLTFKAYDLQSFLLSYYTPFASLVKVCTCAFLLRQ